jgi:hypothetical protein
MSEEERQAIIVRLIDSRAKAKHNLALLQAEVYAIAETLADISACVNRRDFAGARAAFETGHAVLKGDLSRLETRLQEMETFARRLADCDSRLASLGIKIE